ncbi:MAG: hypothetical protein A3K19_14170 [Lentisphaerae bacterium RIFOXYB12_FULL_65_16]|nr:MAG: hypothetical protein A3K18_16315 [Lentisphaerae bacterium RIFOXYA12_64_32]OGV89112.1 MAG: hypothetical protein A3K19_14170 [Lentisphaerae bacterium RIFOXYB12_FULL_65_16]
MRKNSLVRRLAGTVVVGLLLVGVRATADDEPGAATSPTGSPATAEAEAQRLADFVVIESPGRDPVQEPWLPSPSQRLSLSMITRDELETLRPSTVMEALEFEPGVQVKRQGRKNSVLLSLRGEGTVLALMDGMYVGTWRDYRFLQSLPPSMVQEVVIIRDSTSLNYGPPQFAAQSGNGTVGFGGVLDVRLREPGDKTEGEFRAEIGSFRENVEHLHLSGPLGSKGQLGYVLSVNRSYFDGPGGQNMGYEFNDVLARTVWRYEGNSTLTLTIHREEGWREMQLAEPYSSAYGWVEEYDPWESTTTMLSINHVWDPDISTMINAYYRDMETTYHYHQIGKEFDVNESKRGADVRQTIRLWDINTLRFGGQVGTWVNPSGKLDYGGWFQRPNKTYFLKSIPQDQTDWGGYVQDELVVLPDKLTLDGGVRWDRTYVSEGFSERDGATASQGSYWQDPAISYSLGAKYELTQRQTLTARYAYSKEAVSGAYATKTGAQLDDCTENRYELGYECRVHKALVLTLTGFWKEIENGLVYDGQAQVGTDWVTAWKAADFQRYGYEAQLRGELTEGLTYFGSCTYVKSINQDTRDPDDRIPRYLLAGGLRYQTGPWKAAAAVQHTTRYQDDFLTTPQQYVDVGDFTLVDINLGRTFRAAGLEHEFYGGVRNLLDERYETVPGYKDPGLTLYTGYAVRF